jgi:tRNA (mo5U34)-methyltransferase
MTTPQRTWYHTIDLPDGRTTPGWYDTRPAPAHVPWPDSLEGLRCLDVGTFDGFWAFEMERRGAEVVAVDLDDPRALDWCYDNELVGPAVIESWGSERGPGFAEAAEALGSKVQRVNCSVYDLDPTELGQFDVVFCGTLLPHLRDPVRGMERMRSVCRGELLVMEHIDPVLDLLARRVPAAAAMPAPDQWWRLNSAGLVRAVQSAGFDIVELGKRFLLQFGPGGPDRPPRARLAGLAARQPRSSGMLYRALRARPRERRATM